MHFFKLIALFAVIALGMSHTALAVKVHSAEGLMKSRLVSKLKELRPDTLVTFAQNAIDRMSLPEGKALHQQVKASNMTCASCENYVSMIMAVAGNEQLLNITKGALLKECATKYADDATKKAECELAVNVVTWALPAIFKALQSLAWDVPFNLCAILFDNICTQDCCSSPYAPEQLYISLDDGNDFSRMRVTWVTLRNTPDPSVKFRTGNNDYQTVPIETERTYTFGGWIGTINTAVLTGLTPNTTYAYNVGSSFNRTGDYSFTTFPTNIGTAERPLRIINIADMAYDSNSDFTVKRVHERVLKGDIDMIIHNGDISYADGFMLHWDMFMRKVSPFAALVPYMTNPGNHEIYANFSSYKARLAQSMPKDPNTLEGAMYYSLNIGPVRIAMMNSESFIDTPDIPEPEVKWANEVFSSQDRKAQPWSLVFHHRPLYCNRKGNNCKEFAFLLRLQAEITYIKNKVDFVVAGHDHYFQRSYPLSMGVAVASNYENPTAPVYIVNGASGNREGNRQPGPVDAMFPFNSIAVGYGVMEVVSDFQNNKHSLTYSFIESQTNALIDTFTINKNVN